MTGDGIFGSTDRATESLTTAKSVKQVETRARCSWTIPMTTDGMRFFHVKSMMEE